MATITEIHAKHAAKLLTIPGATATAVGLQVTKGKITGQQAIVVFVKQKSSKVDPRHAVPASLDGFATDVVEQEFGFERTATDPFARFGQILSGISVTPWDASPAWGSIGCIINTTGNVNVPPGDYLLTCEHVLNLANPNNRNSTTTNVIQPGDAGMVPPNDYLVGSYVHGVLDPSNDCAVATIQGRTFRNEVPNAPWFPGRRQLQGIAAAAPGDEVYKYGATTKYTYGVVMYVNYNSGAFPIQNAIYVTNLNQGMWVAKGDSGSVLVRTRDDMVLGLNFAANSNAPVPNHPTLPMDLPAYYAGYAYDIQAQMAQFGGVVNLA